LKAAGFEFADVQMVTPIVASFGGELILRDDYLNRLELAQKRWDRKECRFEWVPGPVSLSPIR
jgi:Leu/Phe-tRNA-protein transferase